MKQQRTYKYVLKKDRFFWLERNTNNNSNKRIVDETFVSKGVNYSSKFNQVGITTRICITPILTPGTEQNCHFVSESRTDGGLSRSFC